LLSLSFKLKSILLTPKSEILLLFPSVLEHLSRLTSS